MKATRADFEKKTRALDTLYAEQRAVVGNAPRASHHVFTTLPKPRAFYEGLGSCVERYRQLPNRPLSDEPSAVLEHVLAKLVFETRYAPAAGYCPELTIHWNAPADACEQLARAPEAFLKSQGALEPVRAAVLRQDVAERIGKLEAELSDAVAGHSAVRRLPLARFVSFQCYVTEPRDAPLRKTHEVRLFDSRLDVAELRLPPPQKDPHRLYAEVYRNVAELMSAGFVYGGFLSSAGLEPTEAAPSLDDAFAADDFALTRLELLRGVDVFKEGSFRSSRDDLLEVYPYGVHLSSFVRVFRTHYTRERGRL